MNNWQSSGFLFIAILFAMMLGAGIFAWSQAPVFQDEFNGAQLDVAKWNTSFPSGRTERQFYATDAFQVKNGSLAIRAEERAMEGYAYTSGMLTTQGTFDFQYGCFEIRAQVPKGQGLWPAFWLLPTSRSRWNEIDVFEILGHQTDKVYLTNHWSSPTRELVSAKGSFEGPDFSEGFHTFAVDWQPTEIIWYVDGVERFRSTQGVPDEPMFLLVNLAVGGQWPGDPDATTPLPSELLIDYVRVYRDSCTSPIRCWLQVGAASACPVTPSPKKASQPSFFMKSVETPRQRRVSQHF